MKHKVSCIASACAMVLFSAHVLAEDSVTTETVVVSASLRETALQHAQNSVAAVTKDTVVSSGRDTVPAAIQDVPSVNLIADGTPGLNRVSLRGEGATRTLIMVDGLRLDDQKNKSGVPFLINPFFIDRVEVVRGPSSVLFGSDALGGVVNVITMEPSEQMFSPEIGLVYNSNGDGFTEFINMSGTVGGFKYALGGMHSDVGNLDLANGQSLENTSYRQKGANIKLSYDFSELFTAGVAYEYFTNTSHTSTTTTNNYKNFRADIPTWRRSQYSAFAELHNLNDIVRKIRLNLYQHYSDKDFHSNLPISLVVSQVEVDAIAKNDQEGYGGNLQADLTLTENLDLVVGFEHRNESIDSNNYYEVSTVTPSISMYVTGNYNDYDYVQESNSLYALFSAYLTDKLTMNIGARWNHISTGDGNSNRTTTTQTSSSGSEASAATVTETDNYGSSTNVKTVASIGFVYDLTDSTALRLYWSQGFRAPSIQEKYLYTRSAEIQIGNPDLTPETSDTFEIGVRHSTSYGLKVDAALFYSMADDYIATVMTGYELSSGGQEIYTFRNIDEATSFGLEVEASWAIGQLTPYTSLTWMRREYETPTKSTYYTGTPSFKGRAGLRFNDTYTMFDYYVDAYVRFASHNINENLDGASYFDDIDLPGYCTYNIAVGTNFGTDSRYRIFAAVENLTNVTYRTSELIDEPGRFYVLGGQASF